jgi:hypothetical protein
LGCFASLIFAVDLHPKEDPVAVQASALNVTCAVPTESASWPFAHPDSYDGHRHVFLGGFEISRADEAISRGHAD